MLSFKNIVLVDYESTFDVYTNGGPYNLKCYYCGEDNRIPNVN